MTNIIASIKSRLTKIAQKEKQTYQLILIRYFTERLIYRLSISGFKNHFCLKGGALVDVTPLQQLPALKGFFDYRLGLPLFNMRFRFPLNEF
jgi:hypothetical protein